MSSCTARQLESGAILVEAALTVLLFVTVVSGGLYHAYHVNTHAILVSAARSASRNLAYFDPSGDGDTPPGKTFSETDTLSFNAQGIAIARRYIATAGLNPDDFNYRISTFLIPAGTAGAGTGSLSTSREEIEVAIWNSTTQRFQPFICARSRFAYELYHTVGNHTGTVTDPC